MLAVTEISMTKVKLFLLVIEDVDLKHLLFGLIVSDKPKCESCVVEVVI